MSFLLIIRDVSYGDNLIIIKIIVKVQRFHVYCY